MSVVIVYMDEYYKFYKLINRNIMVIKKVFPLLGSLLFMFSSCMDDIDVIQKSTVLETKSSSFDDILTFNSREDFGETMHLLLNEDAQTLATNAPIETLPIGQSLYDQPSYKQYMNVYVPNPQFAKLLNKKGEIVVSDTVYRITPNGTYFFPLNKKQDFENIYSQDSLICGNLISDSDRIYKISDDIYRIDTYHYMRTPEYQRFVNDDDIETYAASNNVSYGSDPDYSKFKTFDMRTENIWQFLVRNIFRGGQHGHTEQFSYEKRRVKGDFYEHDHKFYVETGAQGWTDKKNWIGWSKTESDELRVGWENVLLATKIPDHMAESANNLNNLLESKDTYFTFPDTKLLVNARTFVIPDLEQSTLKKMIDKGAKALFDWLRSRYGVKTPETDWEKLQALVIVSRTHIFHVIKDANVIKYNTESYTHVFASQFTFNMTVTDSMFSGDVSKIVKDALKSIFGSTSGAVPTVIGGRVHVAARFGNEWRGMNIEKKNELDKLLK